MLRILFFIQGIVLASTGLASVEIQDVEQGKKITLTNFKSMACAEMVKRALSSTDIHDVRTTLVEMHQVYVMLHFDICEQLLLRTKQPPVIRENHPFQLIVRNDKYSVLFYPQTFGPQLHQLFMKSSLEYMYRDIQEIHGLIFLLDLQNTFIRRFPFEHSIWAEGHIGACIHGIPSRENIQFENLRKNLAYGIEHCYRGLYKHLFPDFTLGQQAFIRDIAVKGLTTRWSAPREKKMNCYNAFNHTYQWCCRMLRLSPAQVDSYPHVLAAQLSVMRALISKSTPYLINPEFESRMLIYPDDTIDTVGELIPAQSDYGVQIEILKANFESMQNLFNNSAAYDAKEDKRKEKEKKGLETQLEELRRENAHLQQQLKDRNSIAPGLAKGKNRKTKQELQEQVRKKLTEENAQYQQRLKDKELVISQLEESSQAQQREVEKLKQRLKELQAELSQKAESHLIVKNEKLQQQLKQKEELRVEAERKNQQLMQETTKLLRKLKEAEAIQAIATADLNRFREDHSRLKLELDTCQDKLSKQSDLIKDQESQLTSTRNNLSKQSSQLASVLKDKESMAAELEQTKQNSAKFEEEKARMDASVKQAAEERVNIGKLNEQMTAFFNEESTKFSELKDLVEKLNPFIQSLQESRDFHMQEGRRYYEAWVLADFHARAYGQRAYELEIANLQLQEWLEKLETKKPSFQDEHTFEYKGKQMVLSVTQLWDYATIGLFHLQQKSVEEKHE